MSTQRIRIHRFLRDTLVAFAIGLVVVIPLAVWLDWSRPYAIVGVLLGVLVGKVSGYVIDKWPTVNISRPCYDKMHRCPGWAGGGCLSARVQRCENGRLPWDLYEKRAWKWRLNRCEDCGLLVLPYVVRWVDWRWLAYWLRRPR